VLTYQSTASPSSFLQEISAAHRAGEKSSSSSRVGLHHTELAGISAWHSERRAGSESRSHPRFLRLLVNAPRIGWKLARLNPSRRMAM